MCKVEKPKGKSQTRVINPSLTSFEFISPFQLEACVQLLKRRHNPGWVALFGARIRVELAQLNPDIYEFKIEYVGTAEITGDLQRWEGTSTLVTGDSRISDGMFPRWLFLTVSIVGIPIVLLSYYTAEYDRRKLIRIIRVTLGVDV
jgi:hypothetical protein